MAYKKSAQKKKQVDMAESLKDKSVKSAVKKKVAKIAEEYKEDDVEFLADKEYFKVLFIYFFKSSWLNLKSAFLYLFKYIKASFNGNI